MEESMRYRDPAQAQLELERNERQLGGKWYLAESIVDGTLYYTPTREKPPVETGTKITIDGPENL
jgi:hypothetical protein